MLESPATVVCDLDKVHQLTGLLVKGYAECLPFKSMKSGGSRLSLMALLVLGRLLALAGPSYAASAATTFARALEFRDGAGFISLSHYQGFMCAYTFYLTMSTANGGDENAARAKAAGGSTSRYRVCEQA